MAEVKIGVGAGVGNVDAAIQKITASMNKLGAAVAKNQNLKFEPVDIKLMARDLGLVNTQFQQAIKLSAQLRNALKASGQSGAQLSQVDWSKLSTDPRAAQRMRDRAFRHAVQGTALDPTLTNEVDDGGNIVPPSPPPRTPPGGSGGPGGGGGRGGGRGGRGGGRGGSGEGGEGRGSWWTRRPENLGTASALAIGGGIGGTGGNIVTAGIAGGPIGAGLAAITAAIGGAMAFAKEGIDLAKQQNETIDLLKRQMGDVGISFDDLIKSAGTFSKGLGIATGEFAKLEMQAQQGSGGAYDTPEDLGKATRQGADLARAYGLDPSQGVGFIAGMRRMDSRQENKQLAIDIAEAIGNSQGHATPGEVMQAMMGFVAAQNRFNGSNPDLNRFGNAYASLMDQGVTSDRAQGILGTANSAMQSLGGTEASRNFTMQAFGDLDPVRAEMRAENGIFGTSVGSENISSFMSRRGVQGWDSMAQGPGGTNADSIINRFDSIYAGRGTYGREMEINALKNYFHFKSYDDTAAFADMSTGDHNGIMTVLKNAGVDTSQVRSGGLQGLAAISRQTDIGGLKNLWDSSLSKNAGLTDSDRDMVARAEKSGSFEDLQNTLTRVMAGKGQEDDVATVQRSIDSNIADIKTNIGEKLIPLTEAIMHGVLAFANHIPGVNIQDPEAIGGSMYVPPADAAVTGAGAPYGFGGGTAPATAGDKGIVPQPGGSSHAPGGSTVGGAGNARMLRGPVNPHASPFGDSAATWANGIYGATLGGAYETNGGVVDGLGQLAEMGVDKGHAAAIMANAARESSMNPAARNGTHYGLFQLDATRQADFQKVMGKSIVGSSAADQIKYMVQSMRTGGEEAGPGKEFWASSGADAAGVFARKVERTDHPGKESDIRSAMAKEIEAHVTINLEQHNTSPSGARTVTKMSTTVSKPMASGLDPNPQIIMLPADH